VMAMPTPGTDGSGLGDTEWFEAPEPGWKGYVTHAGGVRMAQENYMLDYWGLAFKQASEALRARLDAIQLKPPAGRSWTVEICGPQRPAEVALGPEFETTWDRKRADFAMMLGTYYCRDLTAPVLVEINREGVDYARVYDIRGRLVPNLLTEPPP